MSENLQKRVVRSQESGARSKKTTKQPGSCDARRNIKHPRAVVKEFFPVTGSVETARCVDGEGNFFPTMALSRPCGIAGSRDRALEADEVERNFPRARRSADLRRRFGVVSGYRRSEIFLSSDALPTVAAPREALARKKMRPQ